VLQRMTGLQRAYGIVNGVLSKGKREYRGESVRAERRNARLLRNKENGRWKRIAQVGQIRFHCLGKPAS
jgi:hypothetical protein